MLEDEGRSLPDSRSDASQRKICVRWRKAFHTVTQPRRGFWPGPWEGPTNESGSCSWIRQGEGALFCPGAEAIPLAGREGRGRSRGAQPDPGSRLLSLLMGVSVCTEKLRNRRWFRQVPVRPTVWFPAGVSGHRAWSTWAFSDGAGYL